MRRFHLALPRSIEDCLKLLAERGPEAKLVAGGTDLLPQMKNGLIKPAAVIDLSGVADLRVLRREDGAGLRVGASVAAREIELDPYTRSAYPALAESGALVGSVQIRNLATVGGNLCNAAPSADMAPPLLALDAEAIIAGPRGRRRVPMADFFTGVRRTVLAPDELLVELIVPLDIAVVGVASQITLSDGVCRKARIALAAVAPTPIRATAAERALEGQPLTAQQIARAAQLAVEAARPISDQRGSADFRRHLVGVLTRRTLTTALERAGR